MNDLTLAQMTRVLPKQYKGKLDQDMVDAINNTMTEPDMWEHYRNNLIGYAHILQNGGNSLKEYINAVRFVTYKMMGSLIIEAYAKTFPDRYNRYVMNGTSEKHLAAYATGFNKSQLVVALTKQALIPLHIINADITQEAINKLAELMRDSRNERLQMESADKLLIHLRPPETKKVELDLNVKPDSSIQQLADTTMELVKQQKEMHKAGLMNIKQLAHSKLITENGEIIE